MNQLVALYIFFRIGIHGYWKKDISVNRTTNVTIRQLFQFQPINGNSASKTSTIRLHRPGNADFLDELLGICKNCRYSAAQDFPKAGPRSPIVGASVRTEAPRRMVIVDPSEL